LIYDNRALKFICNRVGKTVKVDKNTLSQEKGKYARLCVQVNMSKPLLAMFTINRVGKTVKSETFAPVH
jgi:hypothetical protein